ncbi:MAG: hypothetical protein R6U41_08255 [Desulfosalsimonas sp.]|uniref:hypothetical protein n=1 Tax=Desulfosalsimonas sp. TaxID=3073848 RepID=UPI003970706B
MDTELKEEITRLPEIPPDAAMAYKQHLGEMGEKVNKRMRRRPELDLLIGGQAFAGVPELVQKLGADGFAQSPEQAVTLADQALYKAKDSGRNWVCAL